MFEFNLSDAVTKYPEEIDSYKAEDISDDLKTRLNEITNTLAVRPSAIMDEMIWDPLVEMVHCYKTLPDEIRFQMAYLVSNSLSLEIDSETRPVLQGGETEMFEQQKQILQLYGYLVFVLLYNLGKEDADTKNSKMKRHIMKSNDIIESLLGTVTQLFALRLSLLFQTTPERNMFVGNLLLSPINALLENTHRAKVNSIKRHCFKTVCLAVKYHGQASHTQNAILQHLTYFPHLSSVMAELLEVMANKYDYPQLTDAILKEVSAKKFNENDVTGPKSVSTFLTKLSEIAPRVAMRQMSLVAVLLDNNSFTLRCAVVEVVGNIISTISSSSEDFEQHKESANSYIDLLEERLLDANPYVRSRAIQGLTKLTEMKIKFVDRRLKWTRLAVRHLEDRSGLVRRNAIKFLSHLIMTHPYSSINDERLGFKSWNSKLEMLTGKLKELQPDIFEDEDEEKNKEEANEEKDKDGEVNDEKDEEEENKEEAEGNEHPNDSQDMDDQMVEDSEIDRNTEASVQKENQTDPTMIHKLFLTWQIYKDCTIFIKQIEKSAELCCQLLHSKSKLEVIDVMTYFVLLDAYGVENSDTGIKQMLHLVWMKGSNEEGNQVVNKLIDCYKTLYLNSPPAATPLQKSASIAKNLVELTYDASMADLASLEKLIGELYQTHLVGNSVVKVLWSLFKQEGVPKECKRGSIIVLGMLAVVNNRISLEGLDLILSIGLDPEAKDWILTSFSCIALRRAVPKDAGVGFRMAKEDEAVEKLKAILLMYSEDGQWFGMAEEALNSLFAVSSRPDAVSTDILRQKTEAVFGTRNPNAEIGALSQLLFLVGHIGLKIVIYLEQCEAEFKKKRINAETRKSEQQNELDMIGGTNEDDFSDAVQAIKEKELLYGKTSLLAEYVPMVRRIVQDQKEFADPRLQRQAVLCLCKMMCISPRFCEDNLPFLLEVMENSKDPVVRSNAVLGLGDMAVCFNSIIDTNKNYLYGRLQDPDLMVQRTCLMTVTFLILAGQVKVKGQLAQMAKLYVNKDPAIVDMCKLFFTELATKENAIYNGFIDMFSGLTADKKLSEADFNTIIRFVVPFIQKDKHRQQLASRLYQRLLKADDSDVWKKTAFVIREIIPRQDSTAASRKDKESAKAKLYNTIFDEIEKGYQQPEEKE
ncbi:YCS4 [Brettanomyces bruxellensis]|uniref:Condensin complex subunit 1 n=1 Tax=Dekkera bruxellensis TaxID=5007 RepID=A0A7D9CW85_DEKBR|nr:YCS4 [Brettanomyces bruxellensis]